MLKNLACYTCVSLCLIPGFHCLAASEVAAEPAVDVPTSATVTTKAPEFLDKRRVILAKAREANEDIFASLQSFVCDEEIHRFKGPLDADTAKQIDTVSANVSFENGSESYTDIRQNTKLRPNMSSLTGAWSEGEFGTLLGQTKTLLKTKTPMFEAYSEVDGTPAAIYAIDVTKEESPWQLEVGTKHGRVAFRTRIWVGQESGKILKIERFSLGLPFDAGISEIRWNTVLKEVELNGRTWLLPSTGEYIVAYQESGRREWNAMRFSNYRRYGSEVAIKF